MKSSWLVFVKALLVEKGWSRGRFDDYRRFIKHLGDFQQAIVWGRRIQDSNWSLFRGVRLDRGCDAQRLL